jgi:branched-chain amino acid transport system permease protein
MVTAAFRNNQGRGLAVVILAMFWLLACPNLARADRDNYVGAIMRCRELLPGFDENPTEISQQVQPAIDGRPVGVRISWKRSDVPGPATRGWIICWFVPLDETHGRWQIDVVDSQKFGRMLRYDVQQLYKLLWLEKHDNISPSRPPPPTSMATGLYLLQQVINALTLGCLYGLLAVSFNIVYGITRAINLAFGELYMFAAFATYIGYVLTVVSGAHFTLLPVLVIGSFVVASTAIAGWTTDRLIFSKLRGSVTTVPLVASIGLSILLRESARLLQGPKTHWMPQNPNTAWRVIEGLGYDVYLRKWHLLIGIGTGLIVWLLWWAGKHTGFGRSYRACAEDPRMAALLGVDVQGTIAGSFLLSGALIGAAGVFEALQYNAVDFNMGFVVALKALTAALLGGIGSLPGAMVGGLLLAMIETYADVLIGFGWRDVVVFSILAMVLMFRPGGLFGTLRSMQADERY